MHEEHGWTHINSCFGYLWTCFKVQNHEGVKSDQIGDISRWNFDVGSNSFDRLHRTVDHFFQGLSVMALVFGIVAPCLWISYPFLANFVMIRVLDVFRVSFYVFSNFLSLLLVFRCPNDLLVLL